MFHKMPFILLVIIAAILLFGAAIPVGAKSVLFALSLSIKSIILFLLPMIIFGLLFSTAVRLSGKASKTILVIIACVVCSNFLATFSSHFVGSLIYSFDLSVPLPNVNDSLQPAWNWELPKLISNNIAMLSGILLGIVLGMVQPKLSSVMADKIEKSVANILRAFVVLIPLFVTGYFIKLQSEGILKLIINDYALIFVLVAAAQLAYVNLFYYLVSNGRIKEWITSLKNMLPAAISGFSTMSSAATMPLTIIGVEKNTKNKMIAKSVVPVTVNIHLLGDCLAIPIFAYAVMKSFGLAEPSLMMYLSFTAFFVLAKFSVAAVPGGGILVMLPVLESYLGFNAGMLSLITALYILFDPVITCANVLGNGAFAKLIDRLAGKTYEETDTTFGELAKA